MKKIAVGVTSLAIIGGISAGFVLEKPKERSTQSIERANDTIKVSRNEKRQPLISLDEEMKQTKEANRKSHAKRMAEEKRLKEKKAAQQEANRREAERQRERVVQSKPTKAPEIISKSPEIKKNTPGPRNNSRAPGISECIKKYESGGNYKALNPSSGASGAYQFMDSTWTAVTGLPGKAMNYSPAQQDSAFWKLWNNGAGAHHWVTAGRCGY